MCVGALLRGEKKISCIPSLDLLGFQTSVFMTPGIKFGGYQQERSGFRRENSLGKSQNYCNARQNKICEKLYRDKNDPSMLCCFEHQLPFWERKEYNFILRGEFYNFVAYQC